MPVLLKKILALVIGLVVCVATVAVLEQVNHSLFIPTSASTADAHDPSVATAFMKNLPVAAYLMVLFAWLAGTAFGITAASLLIKRVSRLFVPIITGVMLLSTIANFYLLPHPTWLMIAAVLLIPCTGLGTGWLLARRFKVTETPIQ
ncbi:hypothetical protein A5320_06875 [Rheinheimera sp. SA_1]|jgi:putative effector of murein hydrolase LrgA (UPF0299 family)|uniref:hypothetical protein n=1 Tax=Rheinheimera sp. SA_1 TaxID=1827365 RepID=UPI0008008191|nr:hypothetical protein [Rheinheimera sp. SA_1]OBP15107.1 hypothetical protein A5320_06875 [Rheinheimera sp. SA_1]